MGLGAPTGMTVRSANCVLLSYFGLRVYPEGWSSALRAVSPGLSRGNGVSGSVVTVVRADGPGRPSAMTEVTRILAAIEQGDPQAAEQLLPLVYERAAPAGRPEARPRDARPDPPGHGPGPRGVSPPGRRGPGPALEQPRPLLRRRGRGHATHPGRQRPPEASLKHGGDRQRVELSTAIGSPAQTAGRDRRPRRCALTASPRTMPRQAELVKLRLLRRPVRGRSGRAPGHLSLSRLPALDLRPCLAWSPNGDG